MRRNIQYFNRTNKDILTFIPHTEGEINVASGSTITASTLTATTINQKTTGTKLDIGMGTALGNINAGINTNNEILSEFVLTLGEFNSITRDVENVIVVGDRNEVGNLTVNSGILGGNDNTIRGGLNNCWIIGSSDKEITVDNEVWIGNEIHIVDGVVLTSFQFVDGGLDTNTNILATNNFHTIDGTLNQAFEEFPEDTIHIIDGGQDSYL